MNNIEEIKKEYKEKFIEEGSFKVQGTFLEVWDFIEQKLTQQREELISTFRKFMTYGGTHATLEESEKYGEVIFMVDWKGFNNYLSQREKGEE